MQVLHMRQILRRIPRIQVMRAAMGKRLGVLRSRGNPLLVAAAGMLLAFWVYWMAHEVLRGIGAYDFSTYYAAARALRLDPHSNIYSQAVLTASAAAGHVTRQPPLPYAYPPLGALVLIPLTLLPFGAAVYAWEAINLALWLATTVLLAVEMRALLAPVLGETATTPISGDTTRASRALEAARPTLVPLALAILVCLSWAPAMDTVAFGQINFLVLLPLALVPGLLRRGQDRWAGVAIGVAAMIKLTPLLLLAYLALTGRRRALFAALGTLLGLALVTVAIVGPRVALAALPQAMHVSAFDTSLGQNEALLGTVTLALLVLAPGAAGVIRVLEYAALAGLALWIGTVLWARLRSLRAEEQNASKNISRAFTELDSLAFAAALCGLLLVSPLAWLHHYLWIMPAAMLVLTVMLRRWLLAHERRRRAATCGLLFTLLAILLIGVPLPLGWERTPWLAEPHLFGASLANWLREMRGCGTLLLLGIALNGLRKADGAIERASPSGGRVAPEARIPYTVGGRALRGLLWLAGPRGLCPSQTYPPTDAKPERQA